MYYEEQIINGVLCHRGTPDGEWTPFTAEELTMKITKLKIMLDVCRRDKDALRYQVEAAQQSAQADMLPSPPCCASFVFDGTHHKDCRFAKSASR